MVLTKQEQREMLKSFADVATSFMADGISAERLEDTLANGMCFGL